MREARRCDARGRAPRCSSSRCSSRTTGAQAIYDRWGFTPVELTLGAPLDDARAAARSAGGARRSASSTCRPTTSRRSSGTPRRCCALEPDVDGRQRLGRVRSDATRRRPDEAEALGEGALVHDRRRRALARRPATARSCATTSSTAAPTSTSTCPFRSTSGRCRPGDAYALGANPTVVARLTGADPQRVREVARTAASPGELPPAQELYEQIADRDGRAAVITLYDAARCPYCARVRIVLAEKDVEFETVEIDLSDRPAWIYEKNPTGRVPVDRGGRRPAAAGVGRDHGVPRGALSRAARCCPPIPPTAPFVRLLIFRDDEFTDPYYAFRRGEDGAAEEFDAALAPARRAARRAAVPRRRGVRARRHRVRPLGPARARHARRRPRAASRRWSPGSRGSRSGPRSRPKPESSPRCERGRRRGLARGAPRRRRSRRGRRARPERAHARPHPRLAAARARLAAARRRRGRRRARSRRRSRCGCGGTGSRAASGSCSSTAATASARCRRRRWPSSPGIRSVAILLGGIAGWEGELAEGAVELEPVREAELEPNVRARSRRGRSSRPARRPVADDLSTCGRRTSTPAERGSQCDPRQGHIPGARNLEVGELFDGPGQPCFARAGPRARRPAGRERRSSRTATPARARRSRRSRSAQPATTRATTPAPGTSGAATTSCRSSAERRADRRQSARRSRRARTRHGARPKACRPCSSSTSGRTPRWKGPGRAARSSS